MGEELDIGWVGTVNDYTEIDVAFPEDLEPEYHHIFELRHTRVVWRNCLILAFTLFLGTGIQYCFTRNIHSYSPQFYFSYFLRTLMGAMACGFLCMSVDRVGRRGILLLAAIITGLSSLVLLALTQYLHGKLVLVLSLLGLFSSQALAMLSVFFASEVMPTVLRGGALGLVMAAGSVGTAASSLMELQNNGGYFLHHMMFASFAVISVLCIMLLPESRRKALADSLKDGECLRRPSFFCPKRGRDDLPLLHCLHPASQYSPESYSCLLSTTRLMLARETVMYRLAPTSPPPLLQSNDTSQDDHDI